MQTIKLTYPHNLQKSDLPETVAAIGFFDGIHQGHQEVIRRAVQEAKKQGRESAVITFFPHPSVVLKSPSQPIQYITTVEEKQKILKKMNVDRLYMITFNKELSMLSPQEFIDHFVKALHIKHLIAGFDFTFGHKGAGNMNNIKDMINDELTTTVIEKVVFKDMKVSSTEIREQLAKGAVHLVQKLLGRHYTTTGTVIEGDKRGRQLGFPTANLEISDDKLLPKQGVYAVKVIHDGKEYNGMANLGVKPTFVEGELKPSVEVYILDFNQSIYGDQMEVKWYEYIREEKKFNGVEEIVEQLKKDEVKTRNYFQA